MRACKVNFGFVEGVGDGFALNDVDIVDIQGKHLAIGQLCQWSELSSYYHSKLNNKNVLMGEKYYIFSMLHNKQRNTENCQPTMHSYLLINKLCSHTIYSSNT